MENIVPKITRNLSKMWNKILNLENCLFPEIKEQLGTLRSHKSSICFSIWDFIYLYSSELETCHMTLLKSYKK